MRSLLSVSILRKRRPTPRAKRDLYTRRYSSRAGIAGWHFLTGSPESIKAVTDAIGFHYRYDPALKIFVHGSGVMVLTPEGKISRYLYGVEYEPKDLKLGLVEASNGKIGSPADQILLFCYHYDPTTGKYTTTVLGILRLAGVLTLLLMGLGFAFYWRLERRNNGCSRGGAPMMPCLAVLLQGSVTHEYNLFFWAMVALCGTVGTGIAAFLIYCAWHYRRRSANELPSAAGNEHSCRGDLDRAAYFAVHDHVRLWSEALLRYRAPAGQRGGRLRRGQAMDVEDCSISDGQREINDLHVPVGRADPS